MKKIHTSFKGLLLIYLPIYLLMTIIFYLTVGIVFPPTLTHYLIIVGWTILTAFYVIYGYKNSYYELTKHEIIHTKGANKLHYPYKDIVYIDEVYSAKKLSIRFVTSKGDERYLAHDKGKLVYKTMLEKVERQMTKDELNQKFPRLRL